MKLFHGTYEKTVPIIKLGEFAMSGNNVFDGLFSSPERDIATSHRNTENTRFQRSLNLNEIFYLNELIQG